MMAEADKAQYDLPGLSSSAGNGLQDVAKLYNKPLESMLRATGTPQLGGMVGEQIGEDVGRLTGSKADLEGIGRSIGESVPRMIAGGAGLGVPGMMLDTGLQSLATTGNPLSAAGQAGLAGLTMGAAKVGGQLGERAVGDWMTKYMVGQPTNVADQLMNRYVAKEITQGVLPKIGGGVGAAAGAGLESELVRQVQEGPSNPFTVENVFSQAANAAVFSGIHAVGSLKSPRNLEAQGRLEKWFIDQMGKEREVRATPMPGETPGETQKSNPGPIIDASLSGNDTHPQARKDYWIVKMDKAATVVDPMERAAAVSEMTDQILSTKNLNQISLTAGRLSQIKPPETMGELVDVSKRYNDLRDLALRMIDERAASGEDVPSAAAVRQLSGQGLLPKMDLAWLKNEFGDAVERTLTGDDMMAFRVLSQKVMNHTLILARTAKETRAQSMTQASIESSGLSSDALDERNLTMGFVSAVNSVTSKPIRDALAERYIHHEQADQQYGKGEADKFMEEVTDVVNKIIEGKTPEQVAAIDWATAVAQVEKRVVQMSETGEEVRPIVARDSRLADYVATNEHGEYVKKVYGRPNRSQRELLAQEGQDLTEVIGAEDKVPVPVADEANWQYDLGQEASGTQSVEPKIPEVKGGGTAPKGLYDPSLDAVPVERQGVDTQAMALQLKDNVAALDDKKAWFALAPELTTMRGTIDSRKRESVQPYSKQIIAAVLELGTGRKERGEQTGEAIGPAGAALLAAKGMPEMPFEKYRAWLDELMNARVNPKYRENIVKRLAGVGETINLPVGKRSGVTGTETGFVNHIVEQFNKSLTGTETKGPQFQVGSTGQINGKGVVRAIQKWAPPEIFEYYKARGIEEFVDGKVTGDEFKRWLEENTPKVEVKKLVPASEVDVKAKAQHELESFGYTIRDDNVYNEAGQEMLPGMFSLDNQDPQYLAYTAFRRPQDSMPKTDAATGRYGVDPKSLENMPGAVDILVRVPSRAGKAADPYAVEPLFRGPHFGDSDKNVLASIRGYMETLPTGEKVFHVFEVQSDWGQRHAKDVAFKQEQDKKGRKAYDQSGNPISGNLPHPLLAHYETLALKTAIQHARAQGATKIAISDGETAMMTEGHDRQPLSQWILHYSGSSDRVVAKNSEGERHEFANYVEAESWVSAHPPRPKQDTGMRAAYDDRLPAIMRKLTNDRGRSENFGQHVKGTSPVFNKNTITARSYDITKPNPIEQRLFSATQPISAQVKPPTGNLGASNTGKPQADLYRVYTDAMLTKGYTPAEIKQDITQAMQILSNFENPRLQVAAFDPRSAYRNLTPGQIAGTVPPTYGQLATAGMYSTEDLVRPLVTLAMSHVAGDSPRELVRFNAKMSLVHELTHAVQYEPTGVYSEERKLARQQFENFANALSPDNRHAVLKVLADFAIPHEVLYKDGVMNSTIAGILRYGSNTGGGEQIPAFEMVNVASEILGVGMVMGGTKMKLRAEDIFNALPTEAALFIKGEYRNIMDHLGAFGEAARGLPGANASEVATWAKYVAKMVNRIAVSEEPAASLAKAQAIVAALDGKQFHGPARLIHVEELSVELGNLVKKSDYSQVKPALNTARDLLFGPEEWHKTETTRPPLGAEEERYLVDFDQPPPKGPKVEQSLMEFPEDKRRRAQVNVGAFWQWAGLFHQTMAHMETRQLPLAQDVSKAFLGLLPAQQRMSVAMLKPFMVTDGKMDPGSPLVQMRQDKSLEGRRDNELVNRILKWQQENEKPGVVQQADGSWAADPKMAEDGIGDVRGFLPQRVVGSVLAMREVGFNMGQQLLSARIQSVTYRVAKLLMASQPKELKPLEYERTLEAAGLIVRGMVFDQQATTAQGLEQVLPPQREAVGRMLGGGLVDQLKALNKMVTTRSDWWATEQRAGDHLVVSFDKDGVKHTDGAQSLGEARKMRADLQERGYTDISIMSKDEKAKVEQFDSPEGILHHYTELEQKAMEDFVTKNPANLTPDQLALIEAYAPTPGAAVGEMLSKRGTSAYLKQRRGVPTAYGLDYIDSMQEYVSRLSGTISRQMTQAHVELILSDKRLDNQTEFKTLTRQSMQAALTPNSEWQRAASTAVSSYFLGGNLSSAIVNGFDTVSMLPETLLSQGDATYNTAQALGHYMKGMANVAGRMLGGEVDMGVLRTATAKLRVGQKLTPDETRNWVRQRAYDMKMLDRGQMHEVTQETDIKALTARAFGTNQKFPTLVDVAKDPFMRAVQLWMIMPRMVHSVNNQLSFEAGLEQAVDRGMGPQAALDHANKIRVLATFSGGKSNPTGAMAQTAGAPAALSMTRLSATMQAYAFGTMSKYMSHASNMITADANLTPLAKRQARQAFGYMLSTHMAMAGLMGVAGVGAVMALLNKYFDVQAEAGVRKGVQQAASVVTSDPSVQGMVTELAMNGAPNQLFGAAVGARIGMGNVMGLSSYEGFNMLDVVPGAAAGAVSSVFKGLGYAAQGEPQQAIRSLVPAGLKNAVDMAANHMKFGDTKFRGPTGQVILDPTVAEKGMYLAGLQPSRLAQARSLSRLTDAALKSQQKADAKKRDEAAQQMLRGNLSPARELQGVANEANFPRTPAQATGVLQSLADRASVLNSPQDPLASVSYAASPEARRILQTFPAGTRIPASEVDRAKTRIQLEVQAGVPVDVGGLTREMQRAQLVENAMKKGMTRAEALKWVGLVTGN